MKLKAAPLFSTNTNSYNKMLLYVISYIIFIVFFKLLLGTIIKPPLGFLYVHFRE